MPVVEQKSESGGRQFSAFYLEQEAEFRALARKKDRTPEEQQRTGELSKQVVKQANALLDAWFDEPSEDDALALFQLLGSYAAEAVHYWMKRHTGRLLPVVVQELRGRLEDLVMDCTTTVIQDKLQHYRRESPLHGFIFTCVQNEMWNIHNRISGQRVDIHGSGDDEHNPEATLDALAQRGPKEEERLLGDFAGPDVKDLFLAPVGPPWPFLHQAVQDFEATRMQGDRIRRLTLIQLGVLMGSPQVVSGILLGRSGSYHSLANAGNPGAGGKPLDKQFYEFIGSRLAPIYDNDEAFQQFRRHLLEKGDRLLAELDNPLALGRAYLQLHAQDSSGILLNPA